MSEKLDSTHGRQSRFQLLLLPVVIACSTLLASCGGGSDSTTSAESADGTKEALAVSGATGVPPGWTGRAPKMEVINGIIVPPEPAPSINNATLAGVDVNANGVRDDVERRVAAKSPNQPSFDVGLRMAAITQKVLTSPKMTQLEMDSVQRELNCAAIKFIESGGKSTDASIASSVLNSPTRLSSYKDKVTGYSGGILYINSNNCN